MVTLIHITEKQTGKILDYIPLGDFWDDNHHKSLKDTLEYFEFRTFGDKRYSQYLEKMNRIIIPDEDGTYIEFVIFHAIKYRLNNTVVIDVYAPASYLLLKKAKVINPQRISGTASQHLEFALNGTEWRPGIVESDKYRTLDIENHTNPYAYIRRITNEFELEPRFRIETDGSKVIGRYVDLLERVGQWQGREVEFGRDLLGIERKVDDSNVVTALIGLAPERDDGTRLEVFVEDEEALQRWGIPNPQTGELMHLIETYEPESTDQDMTVERLTELTRNELEKRINSVVEYTADVADLEKVPGMENKKIRFGDTIKIKDTGFNPPLYLEARVHTQDRSLSQPEKKKVTLGDYIEYTEEEVHAIWKQLKAEIAKKVSMAQVTEVVYTKPEVDERDDAVREHADTVAENAKREAIQIASEDASQKAQQAEDNAKGYTDDRLQNTVAKDIFESTVTDLLNNIAQKVDNTRFEQVESELRGIAEDLQHEVADHAEALEEHGGKITKLETDVDEVEGKINATISQLEALGDTVSRHETQIDANAQAIALKADKQELDLLSGTVSDISSELSVMAGQIEAKAERSEVEKLESDVSKVSQDVSKLTVDVDGIKTNVGIISQTVSNHGTQISNINSTLTQHADMIATKVEKSEFDSVTNSLGNRISTIEQTADSISLEVSDIKANVYTKSEVDSAIDGIQIGGRNLLKSSRLIRSFSNNSSNYPISYSLITEGERQFYRIVRTNTQSYPTTMSLYNSIPVTDITQDLLGQTVTFSFRARASHNVSSTLSFRFDGGSNGTKTLRYHGSTIKITTSWKTFAFTVNIDFSIYNSDLLRFTPSVITIPSGEIDNFYLDLCEFKIELGNKATDWTPAPEDVQAEIDDIQGTLVSHSTKIEQNAQQIQLRATKAEVDTLSGRVNQAESQITQLAGQIELRATKTEVNELTGRVSTVESTIRQHADMIEAKIDAGDARSIFRQEASSFTFEASQINFKGHVFGEDATFLGKIEGSEIQGANIIGATITGTEINGSIINSTYVYDSIRIGEGKLTAEYSFGSTYKLELSGQGISLTNSDSDEHGRLFLGDPLYDQTLYLYHNKKIRLQAPVIEMFGVGGDSNILEFLENTDVQQIRFNTSNDGRIYFGRYGSDNGWALIGNQDRIGIYDYEYGGAFPIVVRRSPKAVEINGSFSVSGTKSAVVRTENFGRRLMYAVESPDNRFMDVIEGVYGSGEHWVELNPMFSETINGYSVFPIPQGKGIAKILKKETDRFKVYVESEEHVEIAFWVYGKRKGYEEIYMEEVTDFEEGIA